MPQQQSAAPQSGDPAAPGRDNASGAARISQIPDAPKIKDLPGSRALENGKPRPLRARRGGPALEEIKVDLVTTTPILGGGARTRELDSVDIIRAPTIRGHLRFWWRALHGHRFTKEDGALDSKALFDAEAQLWGRAGDEEGGRSQVEVRVIVSQRSTEDPKNVELGQPGSYALWPAREQKKGGAVEVKAAPRRHPGVRFRLAVSAPADRVDELRHVVRAWILFGGYGSRTRRGVGSLALPPGVNSRDWLPDADDLRNSLAALFGGDILTGSGDPDQIPLLAGASLIVGDDVMKAESAWAEALGWLRDFRQSVGVARDPGAGKTPGRSRWPEPDKLRHLFKAHSHGHAPHANYNHLPAWPRASFGLPIVGRFKDKGDPPNFEIAWQELLANGSTELRDRLASPLIVKALPTRGGFVPCALWLNRAQPPGDVVITSGGALKHGSHAPFRRLLAPGDRSRFAPITAKRTLRDAFMDWVAAKSGVVKVAP